MALGLGADGLAGEQALIPAFHVFRVVADVLDAGDPRPERAQQLRLFEEAHDLGAQIQVVSEPEVQAVHAILDQLGHAATVGAEHWNAGVEGLVDGQR